MWKTNYIAFTLWWQEWPVSRLTRPVSLQSLSYRWAPHMHLMQLTHPLTRKGNIMWWHKKMTTSDGAKNNMLVNDDINQFIFRAMAGFSNYFKRFAIFLKVSDGNIKLEILGRYMLCEQFVTILQMYVLTSESINKYCWYCRRCKKLVCSISKWY